MVRTTKPDLLEGPVARSPLSEDRNRVQEVFKSLEEQAE